MANERVGNIKYFNIHLQTVEENDHIIIEDPEEVFTIIDIDGR